MPALMHCGGKGAPMRAIWLTRTSRAAAATAAVAASAVAWRAPDDYSVLSFGKEVVAAKSQDIAKSNEGVIDSVLALRGFGTTDVAGALRAAGDQRRSERRASSGENFARFDGGCKSQDTVISPTATHNLHADRKAGVTRVGMPACGNRDSRALANQIPYGSHIWRVVTTIRTRRDRSRG